MYESVHAASACEYVYNVVVVENEEAEEEEKEEERNE